MTKIKVVDHKEFYFHVHDFFSWNHLLFQNVVSSWHFLKFKFWIDKIKSHEKMTKMKVVDLSKCCFIWIHFVKENYVWISQILNFNFSNDLGWRNNQNESCRSRKAKNFVVYNFSIWNHLVKENYVWIFQI